MNNLILIRHGQSLWNKERRFTGWADIDLTEQGKLEAAQAGKLIKELNIDFEIFFTSCLKRAIHSLEIILEILNKKNVEIVKDAALNERHYGDLTSLNKDETIKKFGDKQVQIWRRSFDIPPPKMNPKHPYKNKIESNILGESLKDTFERVTPFYEKKIWPFISAKKNVLIVFHGNSCRALLKKIFNISNEKIVKIEIPTGNPLLIKFNKNFEILEYNYLDKKRAMFKFFIQQVFVNI